MVLKFTRMPSGVTVVYNNIKAPKHIQYNQGATHTYYPPNPQQFKLRDLSVPK